MAKGNYIINRSNYSVKRKHKSLSDSTIYERDYMATSNLGGFDSGVFPNAESNFKIVPAETATIRKRHKYSEGTSYTLETLEESNHQESTESQLLLTGKHFSLLDFVYYGNCVEFLKATVNDIILKFPAELFFSNKKKTVNIGGTDKTLGILENPFDIDIWNVVVSNYDNDLRYFTLRGQNYGFYTADSTYKGCMNNGWGWAVTANTEFIGCEGTYSHKITIAINDFGIVDIYRYFANNTFTLLYESSTDFKGCYIRPSEGYIDAAFEEMSEFARTLLNRGSNPLYTATLDFPHETESGFKTYRKTFTWPAQGAKVNNATIHRYNIDIAGEKYEAYINELLELCAFYDENFTDNLWRNLTHDAIKNLDNTFVHEVSDMDADDIKENVEKVHKFLNACSAQFDEIKRYVDGIKNVNTVTYDNNGNLPDYLLTDTLNLSGWEISNSLLGLDTNAVVKNLFKGLSNEEYDSINTNVAFLKNLKLNSREILSRKGTKNALEMVLGLFGMVSKDFAGTQENKSNWDYKIDEYVAIAKGTEDPVTGDDELLVEKYGNLRRTKAEFSGESEQPEPTEGLPVKVISFEDSGVTYRCMVPWFKMVDSKGMPYEHDGDIYFQMYGGWDKTRQRGVVTNYHDLPTHPKLGEVWTVKEADEIWGNQIPMTDYIYTGAFEDNGWKAISGKYSKYEETLNYLGVVEKKEDLIYVSDSVLHGDDVFFAIEEGEEGAYFVLHNPEEKYFFYDETSTPQELRGWKKLTDTKTIIKLESIVDSESGNNPHTGFGHYDDGEEFFKYIEEVFKYSLENDGFIDEAYPCDGSDAEIRDCGFEIKKVKDCVKCWYFKTEDILPENGIEPDGDTAENTFSGLYSYDEAELLPYDFRYGTEGDFNEYSSHSIVNTKNMSLVFKTPAMFMTEQKKNEYKAYIMDAVMPYVRQVVPSTAIFNVEFCEPYSTYNARYCEVASNDGNVNYRWISNDGLPTEVFSQSRKRDIERDFGTSYQVYRTNNQEIQDSDETPDIDYDLYNGKKSTASRIVVEFIGSSITFYACTYSSRNTYLKVSEYNEDIDYTFSTGRKDVTDDNEVPTLINVEAEPPTEAFLGNNAFAKITITNENWSEDDVNASRKIQIIFYVKNNRGTNTSNLSTNYGTAWLILPGTPG